MEKSILAVGHHPVCTRFHSQTTNSFIVLIYCRQSMIAALNIYLLPTKDPCHHILRASLTIWLKVNVTLKGRIQSERDTNLFILHWVDVFTRLLGMHSPSHVRHGQKTKFTSNGPLWPRGCGKYKMALFISQEIKIIILDEPLPKQTQKIITDY